VKLQTNKQLFQSLFPFVHAYTWIHHSSFIIEFVVIIVIIEYSRPCAKGIPLHSIFRITLPFENLLFRLPSTIILHRPLTMNEHTHTLLLFLTNFLLISPHHHLPSSSWYGWRHYTTILYHYSTYTTPLLTATTTNSTFFLQGGRKCFVGSACRVC
jgi:hypothetical protein